MRTTAVALALLVASCAGVQRLARSTVKDPKLTFRSVSLGALDMEGATLAFTFDVENPNSFGLDLARISWTVDAEGTRIASGEMPGGVQIRAKGTSPVTFPVRVRFQDIPGMLALLASGRDSIQYRLGGTLGLRTPLGIIDLPISHEDRLQLPSVRDFSLERLGCASMLCDPPPPGIYGIATRG